MRHLKKSYLGSISPFSIPSATRAEELLSSCLYGVEAISNYLRHDVATSTGVSNNSFSVYIQKLLENKFSDIIRHFTKGNEDILSRLGEILTKIECIMGSEFRPDGRRAFSKQQPSFPYIDLLNHEPVDIEVSITCGPDWVPLVKATTKHVAESPAEQTKNYETCDEKLESCSANFGLRGKCVLCVGGHARLYPEYRRLVETSGGDLIIFRGDQTGDMFRLGPLLSGADMVVCPVDCVNHETYFTVKRYCKCTCKPCVFLSRSNLPTFFRGVEALVGIQGN